MYENPYASPQSPLGQQSAPATEMSFLSLLFSFRGRISRSKYWLGTLLAYGLLIVVAVLIAGVAETMEPEEVGEPTPIEWNYEDESMYEEAEEGGFGLEFGITLLLLVPFFWVMLAVQVKRWHDRARSGWMCLVVFIPFGGVWIFVECGCLEGTPGPNEYGPNPLG